ncbi:MAG: ATP-binding protein [Bacteroidia bacterium]
MEEALPAWTQSMARLYYAGTVSQFILHGNLSDYVAYTGFPKLVDFLLHRVFRRREIVMLYNRAQGLLFRDKEAQEDFQRFWRGYESLWGSTAIPKEPAKLFPVLHSYFQLRLREGKRMAFILENADTLVPAASTSYYTTEDRQSLVYLLKWAEDSLLLAHDMTLVLLAENLGDLHPQLIRNPHTAEMLIPYPDSSTRKAFLEHLFAKYPELQNWIGLPVEVLAYRTGGFKLIHIETFLGEVRSSQSFTEEDLMNRKKIIVESEGGGFLELVESPLTLDAVAGHHAAKTYFRQIVSALRQNKTDVIPMGFLITGPVGTGKTFLIRCLAGELGMPMVMLKNFRSPWVGQTEGNLERILQLLKALAPVAVMIDEADTQLGQRASRGDSGVSARVFGKIAAFMSQTENRGRILWFLLTARPDLLPVDFKRQGRAEEHIPLFYPHTVEEKKTFFALLLRRLEIPLDVNQAPEGFFENLPDLSGADIEALLTRAKLHAYAQGRAFPTWQEVQEVQNDFLPPSYPEEIALMNYLAVLECTRKSFLPAHLRALSRKELQEKISALQKIGSPLS